MPQHLTVPIYQRPYVWTEDEQWGPLWGDIRRIAEHRLGSMASSATHFLGAVVTQQADAGPVGVQEFQIVDGQQRLTTLQLILDAAAAAFAARDIQKPSKQLQFLTHNDAVYIAGDGPGLKLRHSNRDRAAFEEVMQAEPPLDHATLKNNRSLIVKAHEYFAARVGQWLDDGPESAGDRAEALSGALQNALQLVVIRLDASEDSQEIFETLNARGTPLTSADLIKNFVFQRLRLEGHDEAKVYQDAWPFETPFWEAEISVGRFNTTRSALFLGQWLISRVGQEVSPRSTFTRFKFFVEQENQTSMIDLLNVIAEQAELYRIATERSWDNSADLNRLELHIYRMAATQSEITKPILLWLTEPGSPYSEQTIDRVITAVESWIFRRRLLRLQSSDQGRIAALVIESGRGKTDGELAGVIESFLSSQQSASTYWPGDEEITRTLATDAFYRRFSKAMQRVILQAVEDWYRGYATPGLSKTGSRVPRDNKQVEHILPRNWKANWPVEDVVAQADRDDHVNRLGNLTLITASLNASVSNGPWLGEKGKRAALNKHDVLLMNRELSKVSGDGWNEQLIDQRTAELTKALLDTWPVPEGHQGNVIDRATSFTKTTITYADLVTAGLLKVGTVLVCIDPHWPDARCEVLPAGEVLYQDVRMKSPAHAARVVRGGKSGNAWWFWQVEGGPELHELREQLLESTEQETNGLPGS